LLSPGESICLYIYHKKRTSGSFIDGDWVGVRTAEWYVQYRLGLQREQADLKGPGIDPRWRRKFGKKQKKDCFFWASWHVHIGAVISIIRLIGHSKKKSFK